MANYIPLPKMARLRRNAFRSTQPAAPLQQKAGGTLANPAHRGVRKEEKFLFDHMVKELGKIGKNLITHGMMVEHDSGRLYMSDLEKHSTAMTKNLLQRQSLE